MTNVKIIIPTRGRIDEAKRTLRLVPSATLLLHKNEASEYSEKIKSATIMTHDITGSLAKIRQFALDKLDDECVFFCDDDLKSVRSLQSQEIYKDAEDIEQMIYNGYMVAKDIGVSLFCFNRNANPIQYFSYDPIGLVHPVAGAFGIIGRKFCFDCRLTTREDVDLTMQALLKDRIVIGDRRFYFDFGAVWKGKGGNQGLRTSQREKDDVDMLSEKWGYLLNTGESKNRLRKKNSSGAMSIRVRRKQ
jgi:hypothetical protein